MEKIKRDRFFTSMALILTIMALSIMLLTASFTHAEWSDQFNMPGINGVVHAVVKGSGNDVYVAGNFTSIDKAVFNGIAKWDGTSWSALGAGIHNSVYALAYDSTTDTLYAGGNFYIDSENDNDFLYNIARWDVATSTWNALGTGINNQVKALAYDSETQTLYAGGWFTTAGEISVNNIAQWDVATSTWSALGTGMEDSVYALAYDSVDDTLYAGGSFTEAGGDNAAKGIAKWDGASWSHLGDSGMWFTNTFVLTYDSATGTLYVGGSFSAYTNIAKWDVDASEWSGIGDGLDGAVCSLAYDSGTDTLYAGGDFTTAGGNAANRIAKWDGVSWNALGAGMDKSVSALTYDSGTQTLYAGGYFASPAHSFAAWNDGTWVSLTEEVGHGVNSDIKAYVYDDVGNLYAGGYFTTAGGIFANRIAKWDGTSWNALGEGMNSTTVSALAYDSVARNLYAGGNFSTAGGISANRIAKWDVATSTWSALGTGVNNQLKALAYDSATNTLYVGGSFTTAGGISANRIAKWDGTSWSALGEGMNREVLALTYDSATNTLYAGGYFTTAGGISANHIAKWDGTSWNALGAGMGFTVSALTYDSVAQNLYAGGGFSTAGGISARYVAAWDGISWSQLSSGPGFSVNALAYESRTQSLYAGGPVVYSNGNASPNISRWNGVWWGTPDLQVDHEVYALAYQNRKLYVGGVFKIADGTIPSCGIGLWTFRDPVPVVTSVSSSAANGSYSTGAVIPITITFGEPVLVYGTPQLTLETGSDDVVVDYTSGNGTDTLTFNYTVEAGHASADLDYVSVNALDFKDGAIMNLARIENADRTLPVPSAANSLGANKDIIIDASATESNSYLLWTR